jgi:acetyltransferase-like isoleucine patch superfamily enzyme
MNRITQYILRDFRPKFYGWLTRLVYSGKNIKIGKKLLCDGVPRILIDKNAGLEIGDNLELRRNLEIRVHGSAKVIIGDNVRLDRGIRILAANQSVIQIKKGTRIGLYSVLNGGDSITIGEKSLISGFVYLQTSMHGFKDKNFSVQDQGYDHLPISLEDDVWIGTHVVILPGVTLGKGVVVGSNAVVNKSVEEFKVVGGIPAKELKERK